MSTARPLARDVWPVPVALTGAGLVAFAVGAGRGAQAGAAVVVLGAVLVGLCCWRASVYGLLLYVPFSGFPALVLHEHRAVAALLKDVLFVVPAYLGFTVSVLARRLPPVAPGLPVLPLAALAVLVCVQTQNPLLPNRLVGLIGLKLWLGSVPLYLLGYHLVRDTSEAARLFRLVALAAVPPAAVGVAQAVLLHGGHADLIYRLYGSAAAAVTQEFAAFQVGDGVLRRVPGTLPFVTQFFFFLAASAAVAFGWRQTLPRHRRGARLVADAVWLGLVLAGFLAGARLAFVFLPLLVLLLCWCTGGSLPRALLVCAGAALLAMVLLGVEADALVRHLTEVVRAELRVVVVDGFARAWTAGWLGLGAGADATAARYAFADPALWQAVDGVWHEGWFVRAWLELGVVGLALVLLVYGAVVVELARRLRRVADAPHPPSPDDGSPIAYRVSRRTHHAPRTTHDALGFPQAGERHRAMCGAVLALLIWALLTGVKGQTLDLDPLNMYFWLFAGVAARIAGGDA